MMFSIVACSDNKAKEDTTVTSEGFISAKAGNYDSADTAIVVNIDSANTKICFKTTAIGKKYTLYYDGATVFEDKYGTGMSISQLNEGDLVDVTFIKTWKRLNSLKLSKDQFSFKNVSEYQISNDSKHVMIAGEQYTFDDNYAIVYEGSTLELMDINSVDILSFAGFDHTIYSVKVEQSHGYLRLINDSYFVGGWVEVNQKQICQIEEDMILAVPVGSYSVTVSNEGSSGSEIVNIEKGQEYELDVSKWAEEAKYGDIIFALEPENARVYIDGETVDTSTAVSLEYGIHQMIVVADGYQTISRYIKVASESATLDLVMESKEKGIETESVSVDTISENDLIKELTTSNNTVSYNVIRPAEEETANKTTSANSSSASVNNVTAANSSANNNSSNQSASSNTAVISDNYKVYIDGPSGVEVYVDGGYVGIAPVGFSKKAGSVVVTLRKTGYETRSYTLNIDSEKKDVNYSFSELNPIE